MFYFANVLLSLISLYLFYLVLKRLTKNKWLIGLGLFLFVTNFYLYWYPQWAMAENLLLPLIIGSFYLILVRGSLRNIFLAAFVAIAFYATKYVAAPLALFYIIIFSIKLFFEKERYRKIGQYFFFLFLLGVPLMAYLYYRLGISHIKSFIELVAQFFPVLAGTSKGGVYLAGDSSWTSPSYLLTNFPRYFKATLGFPERSLWDFSPIMPSYLAIIGYLGIVLSLLKKQTRLFAAALLTLLFGQILFVSTFYALDMRYVYNVIPTLIVGVILFFIFLRGVKRQKLIFWFLFGGLFVFYSLTNGLRIKNQIVLNLKYAEVPWYYISVLRLNDYFQMRQSPKPMVISPMIPYLIDFYSNGNYNLLPLAKAQEFRSEREKVWGPGDYSDLYALYKKYLNGGYELYVSTYGLGIESYLHEAFNNLYKDFDLTEVQNECFTQCRIYKMKLKNAKNN